MLMSMTEMDSGRPDLLSRLRVIDLGRKAVKEARARETAFNHYFGALNCTFFRRECFLDRLYLDRLHPIVRPDDPSPLAGQLLDGLAGTLPTFDWLRLKGLNPAQDEFSMSAAAPTGLTMRPVALSSIIKHRRDGVEGELDGWAVGVVEELLNVGQNVPILVRPEYIRAAPASEA